MDYNPGIFTTDNNELNYRIEVTDPDGFSQRFTMVHDWCNGLGIYTRYFQSGPSGGTVEVTGAFTRRTVYYLGLRIQGNRLSRSESHTNSHTKGKMRIFRLVFRSKVHLPFE